jgi:hypothetical protein
MGAENVAEEKEASGLGAGDSAPSGSREAFGAGLKRRGRAARGLERDLLTEVPMLYGSASAPAGDPGIVLARLHREDMLRRNGGGVFQSSGKGSDASLPFEHSLAALSVLLFLWVLFEKLH